MNKVTKVDSLIDNIMSRDIKIQKTKLELVMYWYEQGRDLTMLKNELNSSYDDLVKVIGLSKGSIYNYVKIGNDERVKKLLPMVNGGDLTTDTKCIEQFNQKQIVRLCTLNDFEFIEALKNGKLPSAKSDEQKQAQLTTDEKIEHKQEQIILLETEIEELQRENDICVDSNEFIDVELLPSSTITKIQTQKTVNQIDARTNEVIASFESLTKASEVTNYSKSSISKCCTGMQKKAHGFKWHYEEN